MDLQSQCPDIAMGVLAKSMDRELLVLAYSFNINKTHILNHLASVRLLTSGHHIHVTSVKISFWQFWCVLHGGLLVLSPATY